MDVFQGRVFVYLHMEADVQLGTDVIDPQVMDGADHVRSTRHLHYLFLDLGRSRLPQDVAGVLPEHFKRGSAHKTSHNNAEHQGLPSISQGIESVSRQHKTPRHERDDSLGQRQSEVGNEIDGSETTGHFSLARQLFRSLGLYEVIVTRWSHAG